MPHYDFKAGNNFIAAGQTNKAVGNPNGAKGDTLSRLIIIPQSTSPGSVAIKDGSLTAMTIFVGGASSVTTLAPMSIEINAISTSGAWQITTGASVTCMVIGSFK